MKVGCYIDKGYWSHMYICAHRHTDTYTYTGAGILLGHINIGDPGESIMMCALIQFSLTWNMMTLETRIPAQPGESH